MVNDRQVGWGERPWQAIPVSDRLGEYHPVLLAEQTLGDVLLTPTQIYVKPILAARKAGLAIHGMAHITGGGLPENTPRCLAQGQSVFLDPSRWQIPPIFQWLAAAGDVSSVSMFNTFNMGIGFVVIVPPAQVETVIDWFQTAGLVATAIGEVIAGSGIVLGLPQ